MSHSPAPWTIEEYGDDDCPSLVIHKDTESRICFMATPGSHGDPAVITADAHLIAAAPDLLAAIQKLMPFMEEADMMGVTEFERAVIAARAAIVKATS